MRRLGPVVVLMVATTACGDPGGTTMIEVSLAELPCQRVDDTGVWESAPFPPITDDQCLWFSFEPNNTYVFDHPLGRVPLDIIGYIAFGSDGVASTIGSGNVFLIIGADESTLTVRNGQNQHFWLRLAVE